LRYYERGMDDLTLCEIFALALVFGGIGAWYLLCWLFGKFAKWIGLNGRGGDDGMVS
jgi:hypothetical protein